MMGSTDVSNERLNGQHPGPSDGQTAEQPKRRTRGPNKPKAPGAGGGGGPSFLAALRQTAEQHRAKLSTLLAERAKVTARLMEIQRQLDELEQPIREVEELLARHPPLAFGPGEPKPNGPEQPDDGDEQPAEPGPEQPQPTGPQP